MVMNEFVRQSLMFMGSYIGIIVAFYWTLQWMTKGFLGTYLKVKMSKGKLVLTVVHSKTDVYYRPGIFDAGSFKYKTRGKKKKLLTDVTDASIYHTMGIFAIDVDETNDNVFTIEKKAAIGTNATTADDFVNRAIMSPEVEDPFKRAVIVILVVLVLAVVVVAFMQYNTLDAIAGLSVVGVI